MKLTAEQNKFLSENKVFPTSKAGRVGLDRRDLRAIPDVISLGAFPIKKPGDKMCLENIWTRDAHLIELVKKSKKALQREDSNVKDIINEIESIVRDKLGFNLPVATKDITNDSGTTDTSETGQASGQQEQTKAVTL